MSVETNPLAYILFALILPKCGMEVPPVPVAPKKQSVKVEAPLQLPTSKPPEALETDAPRLPTAELPGAEKVFSPEQIRKKVNELESKYQDESMSKLYAANHYIKGCQQGAQEMARLQNLTISEALPFLEEAGALCGNQAEENWHIEEKSDEDFQKEALEQLQNAEPDDKASSEEQVD